MDYMDYMEYNTDRNHLSMREYGRHVQKMVEYVLTLENADERQQQAQVVIELMGLLNPHLKNVEDFRHMLWDHLFFISGFKLDVKSPYPIPEKETYKSKPLPMAYPKRYPKFSHLGKNLEVIVDKALHEEDPEKKAGFANTIAYYMKLVYSNWHKELVHDDTIRSEMNTITNGQLEFSNTPFIKHRPQIERDEYERPANRRNYNTRGGSNNNNQQPRDNRTGSNRSNGMSNQRSSNNNIQPRDNRTGSNNTNNRNQNFKKRFK